jgi:hypothetical protein
LWAHSIAISEEIDHLREFSFWLHIVALSFLTSGLIIITGAPFANVGFAVVVIGYMAVLWGFGKLYLIGGYLGLTIVAAVCLAAFWQGRT